jgi:Activator of Hsp90 ATPase homolog 1-like protein
MTRNKAQKRATRARMSKTGERYTAARIHAARPKERLRQEDLPQTDANLRQNTGKGWREWFRILDAWGAKERKHGETASYLREERGVDGWWAQSITVGYERARGLRAKHQQLSGSFQVSTSKTLAVGVGRVFKAFAEAPQRNRWLERGMLKVRTSMKNRSVRFDFRDGTSRVVASFDPKGRSKTSVTIQHEKLPDAGAVDEMRAMWKERLNRLAKVLEG